MNIYVSMVRLECNSIRYSNFVNFLSNKYLMLRIHRLIKEENSSNPFEEYVKKSLDFEAVTCIIKLFIFIMYGEGPTSLIKA